MYVLNRAFLPLLNLLLVLALFQDWYIDIYGFSVSGETNRYGVLSFGIWFKIVCKVVL